MYVGENSKMRCAVISSRDNQSAVLCPFPAQRQIPRQKGEVFVLVMLEQPLNGPLRGCSRRTKQPIECEIWYSCRMVIGFRSIILE